MLLNKIAWWTTLKATEMVIKVPNKKTVCRLTFEDSPTDWVRGRPRLRQWKHPLTAGELLVWIDIRFRMGVLNKKRTEHYWSTRPGHGDPIIMAVMKKNRFLQTQSCLSFCRPGAPPGFANIAQVDSALHTACQYAIGITQHFAIDESMIKCYSRYCKWKQYMPRKPIKTGIKVFSLVLECGFLYNWHVFQGSADPLRGGDYMFRYVCI